MLCQVICSQSPALFSDQRFQSGFAKVHCERRDILALLVDCNVEDADESGRGVESAFEVLGVCLWS